MTQLELNLFPEPDENVMPARLLTEGQAYWLREYTGRDWLALDPPPSLEAVSRLLSDLFAWGKAEAACDYQTAPAWANRVERIIRRDFFADWTYYELMIPKRNP